MEGARRVAEEEPHHHALCICLLTEVVADTESLKTRLLMCHVNCPRGRGAECLQPTRMLYVLLVDTQLWYGAACLRLRVVSASCVLDV